MKKLFAILVVGAIVATIAAANPHAAVVARKNAGGIGGDYSGVVLADTPRAYWRLEETTGGVGADETGNGYALAHTNTPALGVAGGTGGSDKAISYLNTAPEYSFDGSDAGVSSYPFTLECLFKVESGNGGSFLSFGNSGNDNQHAWIGCASSTGLPIIFARGTSGDSSYVTGTTVVNDGQWHHLVGVFTNTTNRKLYLDGVLEVSPVSAVTDNVSNYNRVTLGQSSDLSPSGLLTGAVDEAAVYDVALSEAQILEHVAELP